MHHLKPRCTVNFMTDYIRRFIDHPDKETQKRFADLFGAALHDHRAQCGATDEPYL